MPSVAALRPADNHHPAIQAADRDDTRLAVVLPLVGPVEGQAAEYGPGIREVEPSLGKRPLALAGVEGDLHDLNLSEDGVTGKVIP